MKLKHLFFILVLLMAILLCIVLVATAGKQNSLLFIIEGVIFSIVIFLIFFYRKAIKPLNSIANGMELLNEQDFSSRLRETGQYENDRIVNVFNKMMMQLKNEKLRILEQNHFLDMLISASPMGVIITSFDGNITQVNKSAVKFLALEGEESIIGQRFKDIHSQLGQEIAVMQPESSKTVRLGDSMIYRCSCLSFFDRGFLHPFILIESLTDEVIKAEKKAYEKVIRMIAHEVNNTVAGITSSIDSVNSVLKEMDDTEEIVDLMKISQERCMRMSRFITNFADVVKIPEPLLIKTKLNNVVFSCKTFMERVSAGSDINIKLELCNEDPIVDMDISLFEQVLVNIIKNANESIGESGEIIIKTTNNPVMLEIADNGDGISKEVEEKLFTPFFSTKPNGQGIGLIFIRDVLKKHNCTFSLHTYSDGYTRFKIHFNNINKS